MTPFVLPSGTILNLAQIAYVLPLKAENGDLRVRLVFSGEVNASQSLFLTVSDTAALLNHLERWAAARK